MPPLRVTVFSLLLLHVFGGCAQLIGGKTDIPARRKFIIEATPQPLDLPGSKRPYPYRVQVERLAVSGQYDQNQIVFRLSDYELKDDRWNIWSVRPSQMLTDAVERYIGQANLFIRTSQEFLDERPDYILTGTVKAIERFDSGDLWFAHLAMSLKLVNQETNEVFWSREFDEKPRVYNEDMAYTVETLHQILRNQMQQAIRDIDFKFLNMIRQKKGTPLEVPARPSGQPLAGDTARTDTTLNTLYAPNLDYEIIPGKQAPE